MKENKMDEESREKEPDKWMKKNDVDAVTKGEGRIERDKGE